MLEHGSAPLPYMISESIVSDDKKIFIMYKPQETTVSAIRGTVLDSLEHRAGVLISRSRPVCVCIILCCVVLSRYRP
jgi:hypothetical protein